MGTKPTYDEVTAAYDKLVAEKERYRLALGEAKEALGALEMPNGVESGLCFIRNGKSIGKIIADALSG